jgi:hypothetical protein
MFYIDLHDMVVKNVKLNISKSYLLIIFKINASDKIYFIIKNIFLI